MGSPDHEERHDLEVLGCAYALLRGGPTACEKARHTGLVLAAYDIVHREIQQLGVSGHVMTVICLLVELVRQLLYDILLPRAELLVDVQKFLGMDI